MLQPVGKAREEHVWEKLVLVEVWDIDCIARKSIAAEKGHDMVSPLQNEIDCLLRTAHFFAKQCEYTVDECSIKFK
jgi:hypothetical protein